ncbi:MAG TPA: M24 family metallopeptidase [Vicinamibacterales bacterium]|nr:M24 family metallopeptidase [Vicinamibacterales bacterium]
MPLDVAAVQQSLKAEGLDGWLLYDFHGSNPIAARLAGTANGAKMTTRRWFYLVPASGEPRGLVHAIERQTLDALPGEKTIYAGRQQLDAGLTKLLSGVKRVAMEYSRDCAIPYISRIDAGTVELVRSRGIDVESSGDLVQRFEAVWDEAALATHREASAALYRVKDRAFELIAGRVGDGDALTEFAVQQQMASWFEEEGLVSDSAPVVAAQENAGDPHYLPTARRSRPIRKGELVLLDLWGKKRENPQAVYADITWVGFTGPEVPPEMARAFGAIGQARDAAVALVQESARQQRDLRGWQVDRAARQVLEQAGFGERILHRTGHNLGREVHGNGVHMDDYESHDDRRLLPGTGFTIEPGLYFESFGVRTEINMYYGQREALVTGPAQTEIVRLA